MAGFREFRVQGVELGLGFGGRAGVDGETGQLGLGFRVGVWGESGGGGETGQLSLGFRVILDSFFQLRSLSFRARDRRLHPTLPKGTHATGPVDGRNQQ